MKAGDLVWYDSLFHSPKGRENLNPKDYSLRGVVIKDLHELREGIKVYEVLIEGAVILVPQKTLIPMFRPGELI